jgi:ABC-type antimicrobial peptide transport system permease subunit
MTFKALRTGYTNTEKLIIIWIIGIVGCPMGMFLLTGYLQKKYLPYRYLHSDIPHEIFFIVVVISIFLSVIGTKKLIARGFWGIKKC